MTKPKGVYVNTSEEESYEFNDWLDRNGYRETSDNRKILRGLVEQIKKSLNKQTSDNLRWTELDKYFEENKLEFSGLEEKI